MRQSPSLCPFSQQGHGDMHVWSSRDGMEAAVQQCVPNSQRQSLGCALDLDTSIVTPLSLLL